MTYQPTLGQTIDPLAGRDVGDWAVAARRSARLTELEDQMAAVEARLDQGCLVWDADNAAAPGLDYAQWPEWALYERLIAEWEQVMGEIKAMDKEER